VYATDLQVKLTSHMNQVAQFERVLAPISDIMRKHGIGTVNTTATIDQQTLGLDGQSIGLNRHDHQQASSAVHQQQQQLNHKRHSHAHNTEAALHSDVAQQPEPPANAATDTDHHTPPSNDVTNTRTSTQSQLVVRVDDITHSDSSNSSDSSGHVDLRSKIPAYKRNTHNTNATPTTPTTPTAAAAFAGFADIHGYASSQTTRGRPGVPLNISNDKVPITWNESQRVRNRQRQRLLHSVEDIGIVQTHESMSRVPWAELDALIGLKEELRAAKAVRSMLHK
jgi:hypothetical protein